MPTSHEGGRMVYVKGEMWDWTEARKRINNMAAMATIPLWDLRTQVHEAIDNALDLRPSDFGPDSTDNYLRGDVAEPCRVSDSGDFFDVGPSIEIVSTMCALQEPRGRNGGDDVIN